MDYVVPILMRMSFCLAVNIRFLFEPYIRKKLRILFLFVAKSIYLSEGGAYRKAFLKYVLGWMSVL